MKTTTLCLTAALILFAVGCGNNNNSPNAINGSWTAALSNTGGSQAFSFTTNLSSTSGTGVTVTNLSFTTQSPCFSGGQTASGAFTLSGTLNGVTSGGYQMTIQSSNPTGNTLTLTGTLNNNTINGAWTLTGSSGCTGTGSFVMNKG